jgi:hypothetical protein
VSRCGPIESIVELPLGQSEQNAEGYLPEGVDAQAIGQSTEHSIAGGDVRIFVVQVKESGVEEIPHRKPPARPRERALPLRKPSSIKEEILARPTFFEHFDSVVVDGTYLRERERAALQREAGWLQRQSLRIYVDLSSAINLYPGLRLIDNLDPDYQESMAIVRNVLAKMQILSARDLIISLHRHPENNFTSAQTDDAFVKTLSALAKEAAQGQTTVHLGLAHGKPPWNLKEASALLDRVGASNLRLAASTALLAGTARSDENRRLLNENLGLWLVAAPRADLAGRLWDTHAPIHGAPELNAIAQWLSQADRRPQVLDAVYADQDEEYLDAKALDRLLERKPD